MKRRRTAAVACAIAVALSFLFISSVASASWGMNRDYTKTRYPIVLVPGVLGFNALFGAVEYFLGVPRALRDTGASVYVVELSAFASGEERGEQLLRQLRYISALSGSPKLNVIAHSQGGLDGRYVLAARPDLFASLTTVGTPHQGSAVADFILANTDADGIVRTVGVALSDGLGSLLNLMGGSPRPQDSNGALEAVSSAHARTYNELFAAGLPAVHCGEGAAEWNGVKLYSWGGTSAFTNPLDPTDYAFGMASVLVPEASDGLVGRCSSHFGHVIRDDYRLNHGDEVNQVLALVNFFGTSPASVFRTHANRLKSSDL